MKISPDEDSDGAMEQVNLGFETLGIQEGAVQETKNMTMWYIAIISVLLVFYTASIFVFAFVEDWSILDATYFMVITAVTVGYGDVTPQSNTGKILAVCFIWISTFTFSFAVGLIMALYQHIYNHTGENNKDAVKMSMRPAGGEGIDMSLAEGEAQMSASLHRQMRVLLRYCVLIVILLLVGATFYVTVEGWTWVEAIYVSTYTLTTVGYGDNRAYKADSTKVFDIFFAIIGVVTVGIAVKKIMGTLNTFYEFRRLSESGLVSSQLLKEVDRNGDGEISRAEFLLAMLIKLNKIDDVTIDHLNRRYNQFDTNGDGVLTVADALKKADANPLLPRVSDIAEEYDSML